jgi:crotonobetainyl-CoA:carnitine CoA-transferase CaiB-like acyl-CoA transferase
VADTAASPLAGLRVVEVSLHVSAVGAGMAASLPGALLRDLGADVVRVQSAEPWTLDAGVEFARAWDHGKQIVTVDDEDRPGTASTVAALAAEADVLFAAGPERLLEGNGFGYRTLSRSNPRLITVRIRPGYDALGAVEDYELLLHARTGVLTQIRGRRPGPVFGDLTVAGAGAALSAAAGALACLYEREATGTGGWVETSLYDGLQALVPMIIGRVQNPSPATDLLWKEQGPTETLAYPCGDGEYLQLWFGAKGAYEAFLDKIGDRPSEAGYMADLISDAMVERRAHWIETLAQHDRSWWLGEFAGHRFRCEPVLLPGEALRDEHVRQIGLAVDYEDPERGTITGLGPIASVAAVGAPDDRIPGGTETGGARQPPRLLSGVRVLDFSAYLAGPVAAQVLAELGADVIKVEPTTGDAHRGMEPMYAAGQRGKRALALNLKSPDAHLVLEKLFRWGDVLHHNSRLGLAEQLGYSEEDVRAVNPGIVYSFASGFGTHGPRAPLPCNDHLMQALSGVEGSQGGPGQAPTFLNWGAIDATGGWVAACATMAALYARRKQGRGQSVRTSLLGSGLFLKSGAFLARDARLAGPVLDAEQTGYGAAYRIYQAGDGAWLAVAVPDVATWTRLGEVAHADGLPPEPPPLRTRPDELQPAEKILEDAFRVKGAAAWVAELSAAGVPAEAVTEVDRSGFISRLLDDPVGRQLGRVVAFEWGPRGLVELPGFSVKLGPAPRPAARASIAALGEHSEEVLGMLGIDDNQRAGLVATGTVLG